MLSYILIAARTFVTLSILTGILYPVGIYAIAKLAFPYAATGSLLERQGKVVGSSLIAQKFSSPRYFQPRPSAADYATIASGASNQGPTSAALNQTIQKRRAELGQDAPADLLMASGSGLDPHISPEAAQFQLGKIAEARGLSSEHQIALIELVKNLVEGPQFGLFGQVRVNVLVLNLALDERFP